MKPEEANLYVSATLHCGAGIEITQREPGMNLEITVTPKHGVPISDAAEVKDGKLQIRITTESLIGLAQLMHLILYGKPKRRKFLGIF